MSLEHHPLAKLFPLMAGAEFDALVADVKTNGLREAVVLLDGKILDGRNRYRACEAANVAPRIEVWDGQGTPQQFVVSKNLHRRHMNESQRAMVAAKLAQLKWGNTISQREVGIPTSTQKEAAVLLNVSRDSVLAARIVQQEGTPEQIAAVEIGRAAVSTTARAIRNLPPKRKMRRNGVRTLAAAGKNPERIQRQQINAEIWGRLRDVLTNLASLPLPSEVAAIARTNDKAGMVDARLTKSLQWLTEFSNAWSAND